MIENIRGTVEQVADKKVILRTGNGFGISLNVPMPESLEEGKEALIHTYLHWNPEQGPALYGFHSPLQRTVFLAIIECPKIGPSIALNILHQIKPAQFLEIITTQNQKALSAINGIGPKKAEQLIVALKHAVQKILAGGQAVLHAETTSTVSDWQQLSEVLLSLNYSKQEISATLQQISQKYPGQQLGFDQLLRTALSFLSSKPSSLQG